MPRTSPYAIRLSSAGLAQLEKRAGQYTLPYFQVQRAKMQRIEELNRRLKVWQNYFGDPRQAFREIGTYARYRLTQRTNRRLHRSFPDGPFRSF